MKEQTKGLDLENTLEKFFRRKPKNIKACVVVNERGLLIVDRAVDGFSTLSLAAMVALISDVSIRVNSNLDLGKTKVISFSSSNGELFVKSFAVGGSKFRIGALTSKKKSLSLLRQLKIHRRNMERDLEETCNKIKEIMGRS